MILSGPEGQNDVLIISYYFPPQNASGAQRPHRFYKYLRDFGYSPAVVYQAVADGVDERTGTAKIIWFAERAFKATRHHLRWVPTAIRDAELVLKSNPIRCVLSTFPPLAAHVAGAYLQRRHRLKWIADFRDPLFNPQESDRVLRMAGRRAEATIARRADAILTNTQAALENFRSLYPEAAARTSLIWNGFDPEEIHASVPAPLRSYRLLVHVGEIYGFRHPGLLVNSIGRLLERGILTNCDLRIQLIGPLEDLPPDCEAAVERLERANVLEANRTLVPRPEARRFAAEADYLLLLDVTGRERSTQVPAKLFDYLRIGKPILAFTTRASSTEWILSISGIPHVCVYLNDPDKVIDRKVEDFLHFPPVPAPPSPEFERVFNGKSQVGLLADLIRSVTK